MRFGCTFARFCACAVSIALLAESRSKNADFCDFCHHFCARNHHPESTKIMPFSSKPAILQKIAFFTQKSPAKTASIGKIIGCILRSRSAEPRAFAPVILSGAQAQSNCKAATSVVSRNLGAKVRLRSRLRASHGLRQISPYAQWGLSQRVRVLPRPSSFARVYTSKPHATSSVPIPPVRKINTSLSLFLPRLA